MIKSEFTNGLVLLWIINSLVDLLNFGKKFVGELYELWWCFIQNAYPQTGIQSEFGAFSCWKIISTWADDNGKCKSFDVGTTTSFSVRFA